MISTFLKASLITHHKCLLVLCSILWKIKEPLVKSVQLNNEQCVTLIHIKYRIKLKCGTICINFHRSSYFTRYPQQTRELWTSHTLYIRMVETREPYTVSGFKREQRFTVAGNGDFVRRWGHSGQHPKQSRDARQAQRPEGWEGEMGVRGMRFGSEVDVAE